MRKEKLLARKREIARGKYTRPAQYLTDDVIKIFSEKQLAVVMDIIATVKTTERENNPFYTLSATEVLQKDTGRVALFMTDMVVEETHEEVMQGAARGVLESYKKGTVPNV